MEIGRLVTSSVLTVGPASSLSEAARAMVSRRVGSAVVLTEDGSPAIITERDLMRAVAADADPKTAEVAEYMTPDAITASSSWDAVDAAEWMRKGGFRHLIVLHSDGAIAGVLSMRDLMACFLEQITTETSSREGAT